MNGREKLEPFDSLPFAQIPEGRLDLLAVPVEGRQGRQAYEFLLMILNNLPRFLISLIAIVEDSAIRC